MDESGGDLRGDGTVESYALPNFNRKVRKAYRCASRANRKGGRTVFVSLNLPFGLFQASCFGPHSVGFALVWLMCSGGNVEPLNEGTWGLLN